MMRFNLTVQSLILLSTLLFASIYSSANTNSDLAGIWKHETKPALIQFDLQAGEAFVKQHDNNETAQGLTLIKDIKRVASATQVLWSGNMYNGYVDAYVPVTIKLINKTTIIVMDAQRNKVLSLIRN